MRHRSTPPPRAYNEPAISPDGRLVALAMRGQESDIWIWDFRLETLRRFTFGPALNNNPAWTPDGRSLLFSSTRDGRVFNIYKQPSDGSGSAARLTVSDAQQFVASITPDGSRLIGVERRSGNSDVVSWPSTGGNQAASETLIDTPAADEDGRVSPDGRYLAYRSAETGRSEIYVRPFPSVSSGRWQISTNGGAVPRWAPNGRELFYLEPSGSLMAVRVEANERAFSNGAPTKLFDVPTANDTAFSVHPDGQRFLMIKEAPRDPDAPVPEMIVVVGWFEELKSRLPAVQ